jgi:hypothetical protein
MIPPPSIIMIRNAEPWLVYFPSPLMASVKIFDHIMELNNPIPMMANMAVLPDEVNPTSNMITHIKAKMESVVDATERPMKNAITLIKISGR